MLIRILVIMNLVVVNTSDGRLMIMNLALVNTNDGRWW